MFRISWSKPEQIIGREYSVFTWGSGPCLSLLLQLSFHFTVFFSTLANLEPLTLRFPGYHSHMECFPLNVDLIFVSSIGKLMPNKIRFLLQFCPLGLCLLFL